MKSRVVNVCETFVSIQGESTLAGATCFFVRLSGCNLRCSYCDTTYAYKEGRSVPVTRIVRECVKSGAAIAEITGGEPLLQPGFVELARGLRDRTGRPVLVETNGSLDISVIPKGVIAVMDVKCPGSGESDRMDLANVARLRPYDEVKFVIRDRKDYQWAKGFVGRHKLGDRCRAVLLSPVHGALPAGMLAKWILRDRLPVRLQVQLHKTTGMR